MCFEPATASHNPHRPIHDFGRIEVLRLDPVDSISIVMLVDNTIDILSADSTMAKLPRLPAGPVVRSTGMVAGVSPDMLTAEHGLSMLVTITKAGRAHTILFDAGVSPDGALENMRRLGVDPTSIEAVVCSHGHFDHTGGLYGIFNAVGRANMPVVLHPDFWLRRRQFLPGRDFVELPTPSRRMLSESGIELVEHRTPSFLFERSVLVTGEVPRVTDFEPGLPLQQAWIAGKWQQDSLVLDDQAMIINLRDRGLIVFTGCGHAGIVNTARYATELTGGLPIYGLVGGFHLSGPVFEPNIAHVTQGLAELSPKVLMPSHCTGWKAQHQLAKRFPDAVFPSSVGRRLDLVS